MKKNQTDKSFIKFRFDRCTLIFLILAVIFLIAYSAVIVKFSIVEDGISIISVILAALVLLSVMFFRSDESCSRLNRFIKGTAAAFLVAFGMEVFVFNYKSLVKDNMEVPISEMASVTAGNTDLAEFSGDEIKLQSGNSLYIDVWRDDINAVRIKFRKENENVDDERFRITAEITDENFTARYYNVGERYVSTHYGKCDFSFDPHKNLDSLHIEFFNAKPVIITGITLMKALPFSFSDIRFFAVFLILSLISFIRSFEWYKVAYNRKDIRHRTIVFVLACLSALSMFILTDPNATDIEYEKGNDYAWTNPYLQMFDGFQNGRLHLDIEPSEELLAMENPYDFSVRDIKDVFSPWDRAYYNEKFYSYYGVTPVLTYFYPYYLVTHRVPSMNNTCVLFGFFTVLFMFGTVLAFVRKYIGKPNFLTLIICLITAVFALGTYFNVNSSDMYAVPGATGSCFLMLCLWTGLEACIHQGKKKQTLLFVLCGLSFVLCLAARPTRALSCLVLAPAFLELLFNRDIKAKSKILSVASFLIPVGIGFGAIMAYNYARFESPFEFGAIYQLTVSDVSANKLNLSMLPESITYYFMQPLKFTGAFPYVKIEPLYLSNKQIYFYTAFSRGALAVPFIAAGLFAMPFLVHHNKRKKGEKFIFNSAAAKNMTYILIAVICVFIAWLDFCMAGVILSYVCDITPLLALLSAFVFCDISAKIKQGSEISVKYICVLSVIAAVTVILTVLELLSLENEILATAYPDILYKGEEIFNFWN